MKTTSFTTPQRLRNARGFTLIELLVVVAIIALLAAGSVGAYGKFINSVKEKTTAKYCVEIAGAISSFYSSYDTLPIVNNGSDWEGDTKDPDLIPVLVASGSDNAKKRNPKSINYLDGFKQAKRGKNAGAWEDGIDYETDPTSPVIYDTWGFPLQVKMDTDFNSEIENPITTPNAIKILRGKKGIVWSFGQRQRAKHQSGNLPDLLVSCNRTAKFFAMARPMLFTAWGVLRL